MDASLRDDCRNAYEELAGPPPDRVDDAIRTIRAARKILDDREMMEAVKRRLDEQKAAIAAGAKEKIMDLDKTAADLDGTLNGGGDAGDDLAADLRSALHEAGGMSDLAQEDVGDGDGAAADPDPEQDADQADAEPDEDDDLRADLREELNKAEQDEPEAPVSVPWLDEMLTPYSDELKQHGLSAQDAIGRLVSAEQALRTQPAEALAALAQDYASRLDPAGRLDAANKLLTVLGIESPGALAQAERKRLAAYEQHASGFESALAQARQSATAKAGEFAKEIGSERFEAARGLMASFLQSGVARDLRSAYAMAEKHLPNYEDPATVALRAAQARRDHAAQAGRARTPRTASVGAEAPIDQPLKDDLRDAYRTALGVR